MLRLDVASFMGQPPAQPISAEFDEMGGSIGRAEGNTLVLPDDKRYISRTQAEVAFRGGGYVLRDLGSATPTLVNGTAIGSGNEVPIHNGDELKIGEYALRATLSGRALAASAPANVLPDDPFADLLPAAASAYPPASHDPFGLPPAGTATSPGVIPADFDPFADLIPQATPAPAIVPGAARDDLNLAPAAGQSVDDLFGLKSSSTWDPLAPHQPLGGAQAPLAAQGLDPLAPFAPAERPAPPPAQRDDAPVLSGAFHMPRPKPGIVDPLQRGAPPAAQSPAEPPAPPPVQRPPQAPATDMVVSWDTKQDDEPGQEIKTVILPSPKRSAAPKAPESTPGPRAEPPSLRVQAPAPKPAAAVNYAPPPSPAPGGASDSKPDELLAAFLEGACMPELNIPGGLTPELMNLVGRLMHESIRGTLDLLLARALTKREVRAQATVIVARENNPLKFSPTVDAAFMNLLAPHGQGFMAPAEAMRDAYNDLRSHQFGFMAGMRAALEGVLARFDPAQLEGRLTRKSVLGSLVPATRRARLWELYEQLYREISKEAQDDFQTLFGREFLRAYEAQIDKLEQEDAANQR